MHSSKSGSVTGQHEVPTGASRLPPISRRRFNGLLAGTVPAMYAGSRAAEAYAAATPPDAGDFPRLSWQTDWPWWRGPQRNGHTSPECRLPTKFGESESVLWKVPLVGRGHSSPIVVGKAIYLSAADESRDTQSVTALSTSGETLWTQELNRGGFPEKNHPKNTEATPTLACDGERIVSSFFHHKGIHVTALDLQGQTLWQKRAGDFNPQRYEYGYAPSPIMYRQVVIVAAEHDGDSFIVALRRADGEEIWRIKRPPSISFSTPAIGRVAGRDQLMISGQDHIVAYDPLTGSQLWSAEGTTAATCGTMVWSGDIALASGGFPKAETIAVKADGSQKVLWKNPQRCYEQSMIVAPGSDDPATDYLYALTGNGIAFCWRVNDGKEMWKERLRGPVSASPILAGGNIYWANESGTMYVFAADPKKFTLVAENRIGEESMASPAVSGNRMYLRVARGQEDSRQEALYCIG